MHKKVLYHFAALVFGPSDPRAGISEFMKNVYHARPATDQATQAELPDDPPTNER